MRKKLFSAACAIFVITLLTLSSCEKKVGKVPVTAPVAVGFCDTVTYSKHIKPIVDTKCVSCHNPGFKSGETEFGSYEQFKQKADAGRIKARVIDGTGGYMPQTGKLPDNELRLIQCWLDNGMKQ